MIARRIATVVAGLLAVTGLGACGHAATTERRHPEPVSIAASPAAEVRPDTQAVPAVARARTAVRNVPAAFRLPPDSQMTALTDHESGASFTLATPDPEAVLSFYRRELPLGAFTIVADQAQHDTTSLAFRNADGWAGSIYATAYRVTVAVRRA
jgi:hypothetical protein